MNSNQQPKANYTNWELLIWMLPVMMLPAISESVRGNIPDVAMSAILGGIGGMIGVSLFWAIKNQAKSIKISVFIVTLIILIGTLFFFINRTESEKYDLITCQICGYVTLSEKGKECEVCLVEINQAFLEDNLYDSLDEMIKEEQLLFFAIEEGVSLRKPKVFNAEGLKFLKEDVQKEKEDFE
jgi:hypothetical protein